MTKSILDVLFQIANCILVISVGLVCACVGTYSSITRLAGKIAWLKNRAYLWSNLVSYPEERKTKLP